MAATALADARVLSRRDVSRDLVFLTVMAPDDAPTQLVLSRVALGARFSLLRALLRVGAVVTARAHVDAAPVSASAAASRDTALVGGSDVEAHGLACDGGVAVTSVGAPISGAAAASLGCAKASSGAASTDAPPLSSAEAVSLAVVEATVVDAGPGGAAAARVLAQLSAGAISADEAARALGVEVGVLPTAGADAAAFVRAREARDSPRTRVARPPRWTRDELAALARAEENAGVRADDTLDTLIIGSSYAAGATAPGTATPSSAAVRAAAEGASKPCVRQSGAVRTRGEYAALKKDPQVRAMLAALESVAPAAGEFRVVDVGGGRGDLALAIGAAYGARVRVIVVDRNAAAAAAGAARAAELDVRNVDFVVARSDEGAIGAACVAGGGSVVVLVGLHACGGLTDDILVAASAARAAFVVVPCCFGALAKAARGAAECGMRGGAGAWRLEGGGATGDCDGDSCVAGVDGADLGLLARMADAPERRVSLRAMRVLAARRVRGVEARGGVAHVVSMDAAATLRNLMIMGRG